jgi:hypothetical protein
VASRSDIAGARRVTRDSPEPLDQTPLVNPWLGLWIAGLILWSEVESRVAWQ